MLDSLADALASDLADHGFEDRPCTHGRAWVRKTWLTNRGVVVLELPGGQDPAAFVDARKFEVGKELGYLFFLYGMGLQVVLVGQSQASLDGAVDLVDNQQCIVQSVHLVDPVAGTRRSHRTWGQVITGTFQDALQASIDRFLEGRSA